MDIQFYGANCLVFTAKGVRVVVDDNLADIGGKSVTKPGDIVLFTSAHGEPKVEAKLVIDGPGEYEVSDVSIYGIPARAHIDDDMFIPVGGNGYTLDPLGAIKIIKKIEPKLVVPVHYDVKGLNYPVPQQDLQHALQEMSMEPKETTAKLKVKSADLPDLTQLIVLEKS
jgi:hypothetical protein